MSLAFFPKKKKKKKNSIIPQQKAFWFVPPPHQTFQLHLIDFLQLQSRKIDFKFSAFQPLSNAASS